MTKTLKKNVVVTLVAVLLVFCSIFLVACGSGEETPDEESATSTQISELNTILGENSETLYAFSFEYSTETENDKFDATVEGMYNKGGAYYYTYDYVYTDSNNAETTAKGSVYKTGSTIYIDDGTNKYYYTTTDYNGLLTRVNSLITDSVLTESVAKTVIGYSTNSASGYTVTPTFFKYTSKTVYRLKANNQTETASGQTVELDGVTYTDYSVYDVYVTLGQYGKFSGVSYTQANHVYAQQQGVAKDFVTTLNVSATITTTDIAAPDTTKYTAPPTA